VKGMGHPLSDSPPQGGEKKSLPPRWGKVRMGVLHPQINPSQPRGRKTVAMCNPGASNTCMISEPDAGIGRAKGGQARQ
jgi:hypothetical protein